MRKKNDYVYLESPIENKTEDIFGVSPYVEQLYAAFCSGAKFVAIDGKFGSGKSSIVNLFQKRVKKKYNVIYDIVNCIFGKGKIYFVNINFLNINQKSLNLNNEKQVVLQKTDGKKIVLDNFEDLTFNNIVDSYHRYFVNQVANDLYKNPYDIEKLFYNNFISYATVKKPRNKLEKFITDKLLLVLVSIVTIMIMYLTISDGLKKYYGINFFVNKYLPLLLFLTFVFALIYGYGFYKPEKQEKSPMLDIDKCRNSLCKILYDIIPKNSTIYFVIDDLDRIDNDLQRQIISLLYNEYYPLNELINGIKLKFIFMIDLNCIGEDTEKEINPDKLFDYIINVSNNQNYVLHGYVENQIKENKVLSELFYGLKSKDYIVGLIVENYPSIRKIKHLFNRIITKYMYFYNKDVLLNNEQLIIICILNGLFDPVKISNIINNKLNGESININNTVDDKIYKKVNKIINYSIMSGIIDNTYYIYLYNFMNSSDILNEQEQNIYNEVHNDLGLIEENWKNIYDNLDLLSGDFSNVYNHIYKYLSNDDKILFLGHEGFFSYIYSLYGLESVNMTDIYKIPYVYLALPNLEKFILYIYASKVTSSLDSYYDKFYNNRYDKSLKESFEKEFNIFVKNMNFGIKYFDLRKYISIMTVNENLFKKLLDFKYNDESVFYEMILSDKLEWDKFLKFVDIELLNNINNLDLKNDIFISLLSQKISTSLKKYILINLNDKYDGYESVFNEFKNDNSFDLSLDELLSLMKKYGYSSLLDRFIIKFIFNNEWYKKIVEFVNMYQFDLSFDILNAINSKPTKYAFNSFYEELFIKNKFYVLYLYSKFLNNKKLDLDLNLIDEHEYSEAINIIYIEMSGAFERFSFSSRLSEWIIDKFDFSRMSFNPLNFWKVNILLSGFNYTNKFYKVIDRLVSCNVFNDYINYYKNECKSYDLNFLNYLYNYANEKGLEPSLKANITKIINSISAKKDV